MIVFDLQAVQSIEHGERGISRFVGELASALLRRDVCPVDVFAWNPALPYVPRLEPFASAGLLRSYDELRGHRVDILHVTSPFESAAVASVSAPVRARRLVATCYDLIPHIFSDVYLATPGIRAWYRARLGLLLACDEVVTDSESAADDLATRLGYPRERLTSVGAGTAPEFCPPSTSMEARFDELATALEGLEPDFILVPAGPDWRKNVRGAVEAYAGLDPSLREQHQLVIASRLNEGQRADLEAHGEALGVGDRMLLTGLVSDDQLVLLYQSAELVVFPSYYEGFGLPVLEARRCGARVVCSNAASLPEVMLEPAALFNPHVVGDITAVMTAALTDPETMLALDRARDPEFTWDVAAARLVGVYQRVSERPERTTPRQRLAIAVEAIDPIDTAPVTSAFVGQGLVDELASVADVRVFVADRSVRIEAGTSLPIEGLRTLVAQMSANEFDHVVYVLGPAAFTDGPPAQLAHVPGHVVIDSVPALSAEPSDAAIESAAANRLFDAVAQWACSVYVIDDTVADLFESRTGRRPELLGAADPTATDPEALRGRLLVERLDQFESA